MLEITSTFTPEVDGLPHRVMRKQIPSHFSKEVVGKAPPRHTREWGAKSVIDSKGSVVGRNSNENSEVAPYSATLEQGVGREVHDRLGASTAYSFAHTVALNPNPEHNTNPPCESGKVSGSMTPAHITRYCWRVF